MGDFGEATAEGPINSPARTRTPTRWETLTRGTQGGGNRRLQGRDRSSHGGRKRPVHARSANDEISAEKSIPPRSRASSPRFPRQWHHHPGCLFGERRRCGSAGPCQAVARRSRGTAGVCRDQGGTRPTAREPQWFTHRADPRDPQTARQGRLGCRRRSICSRSTKRSLWWRWRPQRDPRYSKGKAQHQWRRLAAASAIPIGANRCAA